MGSAAARADDLIDAGAATAYLEIREAHLALAQKVTEAHDLLGAKAVELGALKSGGGVPKERLVEVVKSALGL